MKQEAEVNRLLITGFEFDAVVTIESLSEKSIKSIPINGLAEVPIFGEYRIDWDGGDPLPDVLTVYVTIKNVHYRLSPSDIDYDMIAIEIKNQEDSHIEMWYAWATEKGLETH
jgi:hypothetical protein